MLVQTIQNEVSNNDFIPVNQTVIFAPGELRKSIKVQIINDDIPETDETFQVVLKSTTGDTVLFTNYTSDIVINANDDAYGVFEFSDVVQREVDEGKVLKIRLASQFCAS